jgi:DNA mismatch repair protein MutL
VKIQILSEEMASRIAAGEVVERPASVVKELMENSLDAEATEISVTVERSGTSLIRVTDNGEGMTPEDLALAFERHSTSKLKNEDDLFRIATLGFRGEALPSIASVSKTTIISRPPDVPFGHQMNVEGGKKGDLKVAACPLGTTVEIREIFYNVPARRKFLKAPATELSHICDVFNRMALANSRVHFTLLHDGRTIADYAAVNEGKDRLHQVLGRDTARDLIPFSSTQGELILQGYLSVAPTSFPNARYLITFVNRRYVRDKILTHAVLHGYENLLMKGQYPGVVLFLGIPFPEVDVNVHPAKYEVRFRRQSEVHEAVADAIRQALKRQAKGSTFPPLVSAPVQFQGVMEPQFHYAAPFSGTYTRSVPGKEMFPIKPRSETGTCGFFSSMVILDQILGCYLVCSSSRGLAIIDQHAAHERVAFEKLCRQMEAREVQKQSLLIPQTVDVSGGESMLLEKKMSVLNQLGFDVEPFGANTYAITAVPALLPEGDYRQVVRQMIAELAEVDKSDKLRQHLEERLATIACHSVIRANRKLEMGEMRALLNQLDEIDFATQCPHGRPVLLEFSHDDLDRMFKRIS